MRAFLEWLGSTPWSVALLESLYVWPLLESTHVVALMLFVGTAVFVDLRLINWSLQSVPPSAVIRRVLPWTRIGFVIMVTTGLLLFYSSPLRYYHNLFFRLKTVALIVAGLNAFVFHRGIRASIASWDGDARLPAQARRAGVVSLVTWSIVVLSGRLVAYNWFECALQPQPGWVNALAGCPDLPGE